MRGMTGGRPMGMGSRAWAGACRAANPDGRGVEILGRAPALEVPETEILGGENVSGPDRLAEPLRGLGGVQGDP